MVSGRDLVRNFPSSSGPQRTHTVRHQGPTSRGPTNLRHPFSPHCDTPVRSPVSTPPRRGIQPIDPRYYSAAPGHEKEALGAAEGYVD